MNENSGGGNRNLHGLRLALALAFSWSLIAADHSFGDITSKLRTQIATMIVAPARVLASLPTAAWSTTSDYFTSRGELIAAKQELQEELLRERNRINLVLQIERENETLRRLAGARERIDDSAVIAEIVNTASLPFINRIVIDKGSNQGVKPGQGIFNDEGVIGQLTRVDGDTSQALLLTDKRFWVATRLRRNDTLILLQGDGGRRMRIRFVPADVELRPGDILDTAASAGPFPGGVPVAAIESTSQQDGVPFQEGIALPLASVRQESAVLVHVTINDPISDTKIPVERSGGVPANFSPKVLP